MIESIGDDLDRYICGVPGCLTWQEGHPDDLREAWAPSVFAPDGNEYFVVCPEHCIGLDADGEYVLVAEPVTAGRSTA